MFVGGEKERGGGVRELAMIQPALSLKLFESLPFIIHQPVTWLIYLEYLVEWRINQQLTPLSTKRQIEAALSWSY